MHPASPSPNPTAATAVTKRAGRQWRVIGGTCSERDLERCDRDRSGSAACEAIVPVLTLASLRLPHTGGKRVAMATTSKRSRTRWASGPDFPSPDLRLTFVCPFEGYFGSLLGNSAQHHLRFSFAAAPPPSFFLRTNLRRGGNTHWYRVASQCARYWGRPGLAPAQ